MSWKPEDEEYSVDEIIAEFKNAQLREPEEREADAPVFDELTPPEEPVPAPIPMPRREKQPQPEPTEEESREEKEQEPEEKEEAETVQEEAKEEPEKKAPAIPPLQPGESRVIDITSRVAAKVQQEEKSGKASRSGGRKPSGPPAHQMGEPPEAAKKKKPQHREKDVPAEEQHVPPEKGKEKPSFFKGRRKKPVEEPEYPEYEDYEDYEYEEEEPKEPIPYDFLFAADLEDLPKTLTNLGKKLRRLRLRSVLAFFFWMLGLGVTALPDLALPIPKAYSFAAVP